MRAFRSAIDGEWIPIKVVLPWSFDPGHRCPAGLYLYGKGQHRNRAEFMQGDLDATAPQQHLPRSGDVISIVPYQCSEAGYELERKTLAYIFDQLMPTLPVGRSRVGIYGGSAGARQAIRHPDHCASVAARAGSCSGLLLDCEGSNGGPAADLVGTAVNLQSGDNDGTVTSTNRALYQLLKQIGVKVAYNEFPTCGTSLCRWPEWR